MARHKDQAARRQQLVSAATELIAERGLAALTLAAIADRAGVSHRLVAYYYDDLESLVAQAHEAAAERYYWTRLRELDQTASPEQRLRQLIASGLPRSQDRQLSQVLNELSVNASRSPVHAGLMTGLFDREVSLYLSVLTDGETSGDFQLTPAALPVARNLVALEDAYGFHLLAKTTSVDQSAALDAICGYARTATGAPLLSLV
ncbi:MAG: TetR/AcrR family transcriptional regulator [Streptosporangiaceae bacterium]